MQQFMTWPYVLTVGHSDNPANGACAMDAISWLVHGEHSDLPDCVAPSIRDYVISGNDLMVDDIRQRLLPFLHRIAGSRSPAHEPRRQRIIALGTVRIFAPVALRTAGMPSPASLLEGLPDDADLDRAVPRLVQEIINSHLSGAKAITQNGHRPTVAVMALLRRCLEAATNRKLSGGLGWAAARTAATAIMVGIRCGTEPMIHSQVWNLYLDLLDQVLKAGPEGEPWSADVIATGDTLFQAAGGVGLKV